jgi:hypothetical protein
MKQKPGSICPVENCENRRGSGKLVCFSCWRLIPKALQRRLYTAWNDGDGYGTDEYNAARDAVLDHVEKARAS